MVQSRLLRVVFYSTLGGRQPVREWMLDLDPTSEKAVREAIDTARLGWPVGMPVARSLGNRLWEIRTKTQRGQARVLFVFHRSMMVLLHGFIKKTSKTPRREIELALKRSRALSRRGET